jgi:hypothetical protein
MKTNKLRTDYYKIQLAPTAAQEAVLARTLQICGDEYMRAVHERQMAWKGRRGVTQAEQSRGLTVRKRSCRNSLRAVYSTVLTNVLLQVMKAFVGNNRDAKSQPPTWFKYPSAVGHRVRGGVLWLSKIGEISMVPPYPETHAKSIKVQKTAAGWFAVLAVNVPYEPPNCSNCGLPNDGGCSCNYCICGEPIEDGEFCSRECAVEVGGCPACGSVGDCECEE